MDTAYQGTLAFSSTDSLATLPPNTTSSYLLYDDGPNNSVLEYTTSGTLVNSFTVPPTPSDDGPLRGLAIYANGNVAIYNGTFSPYLSTLSLCDGQLRCNNSTYTGWDTVGSSDFGGVAAYGNYVFVTAPLTSVIASFPVCFASTSTTTALSIFRSATMPSMSPSATMLLYEQTGPAAQPATRSRCLIRQHWPCCEQSVSARTNVPLPWTAMATSTPWVGLFRLRQQ